MRLAAGTNRGFSLARPGRRAEILRCVEEIEALGCPLGGAPQEAEGALVPKALFGKWRLLWATSPDVLLLAALPLVDCGEIRQDIPAQEVRDGKPLEVLNSVELSPRGFGLLGALPQLARAASVKTVVRALAEPRDGGSSLAIRFQGGFIEPALPGLPSLPLPELPSFRLTSSAPGSSTRLLTTFLDSEFRFARSPLGDVFVLSRVD
uniref:Plastid lipid-associated protein/fibrillin conserved domain-containing protein n=1 Tax=Alexandrium catenella TaxID=2925 RepID=A0A7S1WVP5_ALECA